MLEAIKLFAYVVYQIATGLLDVIWTLGKEIGFTPMGVVWNLVRPNVEFSSISILDNTIYFVAVALAIALNVVAKKNGLYDYFNPYVLSSVIVLLKVFLVSQVLFWLILLMVLVGGVLLFTQTKGISR